MGKYVVIKYEENGAVDKVFEGTFRRCAEYVAAQNYVENLEIIPADCY